MLVVGLIPVFDICTPMKCKSTLAVYDDENDKNKSKRVVSDPKPQAFYHLEYYLLPTDVDPSKIDVTLFGIAAKIYPEKQDAKVSKTWTEGNKTWVASTHR